MYQVYIEYARGKRKIKFETEKQAMEKAYKTINGGMAACVKVEDLGSGKVLLEEYQNLFD